MEGRPLNTPSRILILGIGSRLMRDDGIGPLLADALKEDAHPTNWKIYAAETDVWFAARLREPGDYVVLLDAVCSAGKPGNVRRYALEHSQRQSLPLGAHALDWWGNVLEDCRGACLIGIEVDEVAPGFGLGGALSGQWVQLYAQVRGILAELDTEIKSKQDVG